MRVDKKLFVTGVAIAALVLFGFQVRRFFLQEDDAAVVRDFFVDEQTYVFETHGTSEIPPLHHAPGASDVVIAKCFSVDNQRVIGWLERYTPEMKAKLEAAWNHGDVTLDLLMSSRSAVEVRRPVAGSAWVAIGSEAGNAMVQVPLSVRGIPGVPAQPE